MREIHAWELSTQELRVIKTALLEVKKGHPIYEQAQAIASHLAVDPISELVERRGGLTDDILSALAVLGEATSGEIETYLGLDKPNSVASICSKLARNRDIRAISVKLPRKGRGLTSQYRYALLETSFSS